MHLETHSQKLEAYRLQCENIGQDLLATDMKALHIVSDRLSSIEAEELTLIELCQLTKSAVTSLDVGSKLLSESLAVQKLLKTLED